MVPRCAADNRPITFRAKEPRGATAQTHSVRRERQEAGHSGSVSSEKSSDLDSRGRLQTDRHRGPSIPRSGTVGVVPTNPRADLDCQSEDQTEPGSPLDRSASMLDRRWLHNSVSAIAALSGGEVEAGPDDHGDAPGRALATRVVGVDDEAGSEQPDHE